MMLSSAAASTQTTILPTARTTLSMAVYKAIPSSFGKIHKRYLTPTVSTLVMGGVSIVLYVVMNYLSSGTASSSTRSPRSGAMIAFYYGLTGFACVWYYRATLGESARNLWMRGILPLLGGLILLGCLIYNLWLLLEPGQLLHHVDAAVRAALAHRGRLPPRRRCAAASGWCSMFTYRALRPAFFRGEVLNRDTPTRVPEDIGVPVGLFGIEPVRRAVAEARATGPRRRWTRRPTASTKPGEWPRRCGGRVVEDPCRSR